jgi:hypothetical protein
MKRVCKPLYSINYIREWKRIRNEKVFIFRWNFCLMNLFSILTGFVFLSVSFFVFVLFYYYFCHILNIAYIRRSFNLLACYESLFHVSLSLSLIYNVTFLIWLSSLNCCQLFDLVNLAIRNKIRKSTVKKKRERES